MADMMQFAQVDDCFIIPVPEEMSDFFISGMGFLCARIPKRVTVVHESITARGIVSNSQILGYATLEQQKLAGLDTSDATMTALLLKRSGSDHPAH